MDNTTADYLDSLSESLTQNIIQATNAATSAHISSEFHALRTHLQNALGDFATQDQLESIVLRAVETAATVAAASVEPIKLAQEQWQNEQREKLDVFITDMKSRMDTFAPAATVEALRLSVEDNTRHFTSITAGHTADIANLKDQIKAHEKKTDSNIQSIKASTNNIDTRTNVMQNSILDFIESNKQYRATVSARLDNLTTEQAAQKKDVERLETKQDADSSIIRDVDERVRTTQTGISTALYGNTQTKEPGLIADMKTIKSGLWWQTWIGMNPKKSAVIGAGLFVALVIAVAFIIGRPEVIGAFVDAAMS